MIDSHKVEEIKCKNNLLGVIGHDTQLRRVSSTYGGEYAGACPFCGGRDRLRVQPERGLWWCRQCSPNEHWQDVIAYVMRRENIGFAEAVAWLTGGRMVSTFVPTQAVRPARLMTEMAGWQSSAREVVLTCEGALWANTGASLSALDWLHNRGLTNETLRAWRIGFNAESRTIAGLRVESGVTIPYYAGDVLYGINVRRPDVFLKKHAQDAHKPDKYHMVAGSQRVLFGVDHMAGRADVVIVEGEFDALVVWQEASHDVDVLTMGSAKQLPDGTWLLHLLNGLRFYIATDNDAAGDEAARRWVELLGRRAMRVAVPSGKDVTEFWQAGGDVRRWVLGLLLHGVEQEIDFVKDTQLDESHPAECTPTNILSDQSPMSTVPDTDAVRLTAEAEFLALLDSNDVGSAAWYKQVAEAAIGAALPHYVRGLHNLGPDGWRRWSGTA